MVALANNQKPLVWNQFVQWERETNDCIDVKRSYIDLVDDFVTGAVLSQIIYFHLPSKNGTHTKLRIFKKGHYWMARSREEWMADLRISEHQIKQALKKLEKEGIIVKGIYKFNGTPTTHIRLNYPVFLVKLSKVLETGEYKDEFPLFGAQFDEQIAEEEQGKRNSSEEMEVQGEGEEQPSQIDGDAEKEGRVEQGQASIPQSQKEEEKGSVEGKRENSPNGNGESRRMETKKSTDSLTETSSEITKEIYKRSIYQELPTPVQVTIERNEQRMIDDNIKVEDIHAVYCSYRNLINQHQFAGCLRKALTHTKKKIDDIYILTETIIKKDFLNAKKVSENDSNDAGNTNLPNKQNNVVQGDFNGNKQPIRVEVLPPWTLEKKVEEYKQRGEALPEWMAKQYEDMKKRQAEEEQQEQKPKQEHKPLGTIGFLKMRITWNMEKIEIAKKQGKEEEIIELEKKNAELEKEITELENR